MADKDFVFTMTTGRSGTAYLAELLGQNLPDSESHHETLEWDRFGVDTLDLSHMTLFNSRGNVEKVRDFWAQKLARIGATPNRYYVETSHVLMKAGLIENLTPLLAVGRVHLINLKRDPMATIRSFRSRFDFFHRANQWVWYLDPMYPLNLSDSKKLVEFGINGICLWYIVEIRLRAAYYERVLAGIPNVQILHVGLDELRQPSGVSRLLRALGVEKRPEELTMPPPQNTALELMDWAPGEEANLARLIAAAEFDADALAKVAIQQGKGFQSPSSVNNRSGMVPWG